ncbi:hypothetical protein FQA39_LY06943 [Lamprigera yunnana]|nr:hypothetical protein FQA39_LY06943 [Lamprigera yunnana]
MNKAYVKVSKTRRYINDHNLCSPIHKKVFFPDTYFVKEGKNVIDLLHLHVNRPPSSTMSYGGPVNDDVRSPGTPGPLSQAPGSQQSLDASDPVPNNFISKLNITETNDCIQYIRGSFKIFTTLVLKIDARQTAMMYHFRTRPKLSEDAFPTIFSGQSSYLSQPIPAKRKSPEERRDQILQRDEVHFKACCEKDKIESYEDLLSKLKELNLHDFSSKIENDIVLYKLDTKDMPFVMVFLKIFNDLSIEICLNGCKIPSKKYASILGDSLLCAKHSALDSLLGRLSSLNNSASSPDIDVKINQMC